MLIISLINTAVIGAKAFLRRKKAYAELSRLDTHLLEDMGVQLINGKIISTRVVNDVENKHVTGPALALVVNEKVRYETATSSQFEPPPIASAG